MNQSTAAAESCGSKPSDPKQWKASAGISGADLADLTPQRTIPDLFAASTQKCSAHGTEPSPSKRLKLSHSPPAMFDAGSLQQESSNPGEGTSSKLGIIDLTNSTPASPTKSLPSQQGKNNGKVRLVGFGQNKEPRKFVVKNLRKTPKTDLSVYYEKVWTQLEAAMSAIFSDEKMSCSKEELYTGVEILCRQGRAPWLYQKLWEKCKGEVARWAKEPLSDESLKEKDVDLLNFVVQAWFRWMNHLAIIRSIFFYLDRSYLLHSSSEVSIGEAGVTEFCTFVFSDAVLKPRILQGACDLLREAREGDAVVELKGLSDSFELSRDDPERPKSSETDNPLRKAVEMFRALGVYSKDFEPKLLGESQKYFLAWAQQNSSRRLAEYAEACQKLIDLEVQRCELFGLGATTRRTLETYLEDILVERKQEKLSEISEVSSLFEKNVLDVLRQIYSLLQRKSLADKLRPAFQAYIIKQGSSIVSDEKREHEMVIRLLQFKKQLDNVLQSSFSMHEGLGQASREAFEIFINKSKRSNMTWGTDNPKPGEMIAKYVDVILRGGVKAIPNNDSIIVKKERNEDDVDLSSDDEDSEIGKQLDHVLALFRFVHGKAVFEAFYKKDLARRLLLQRSASTDAEKSMLTRLRSECGSGFTHNLEQMFKDIDMAREDSKVFKSSLELSHSKPSLDLNVNVLSASAWPSYPDVPMHIPRFIEKAIRAFENYYHSKHSGRKLTWKHPLAHCQLKAHFFKGNKEIVVSSFQAVVLLLFNDYPPNNELPYTEIQAATNLPADELQRTLQSLACAKYRVLIKNPKGKDVNDTDTFCVNINFSDPKLRIKINQIQAKETAEENKQTHEQIVVDRTFETQAAIVRIMKSRKTITHAELVSEIITATKTRGALDPAAIKMNIEKMIEKEYMERDMAGEGRNTYSYLA